MSNDSRPPSFWDIVPKLLLAATIGMTTMLIAHEVRLATLEASRYTTNDALERERAVNAQIHALESKIHEMAIDVSVIRQILESKEDE